jgi:hypothetical protein
MNLRTAINDELERQELPIIALINEVTLSTPNTVYRYLRGEFDVSANRAAEMCTVLGLELRPKKKKKQKRR